MKNNKPNLFLFLFLFGIADLLKAQVISTGDKNADTITVVDEGVAVTPSSIRLFLRPGETIIKEIKVTNKTKRVYSFSAAFNDFNMGENGKPQQMDSSFRKFSLSKWAVASPMFSNCSQARCKKCNLL